MKITRGWLDHAAGSVPRRVQPHPGALRGLGLGGVPRWRPVQTWAG